MVVWIDPKIYQSGEYAYNATLSELDLRVRMTLKWHTLKSSNGQCYQMEWSSEKAARGPLGARQKEAAKALKAQLEPQFRAALEAAGWSEETYGFWGKLWTRSDD
jgi:hypothetical protein